MPRDGHAGALIHSGTVRGDRHRRRAATLLLVTSALWIDEWLPVLLVATWVSWLVLHERLEGALGEALARLWRRHWPPRAWLLVPLLATSTLAYWVHAPLPGKISPISLNLLGLSMVLLGNSWQAIVRLGRLGRAPYDASPRRRPVVHEPVIDRPTTSRTTPGTGASGAIVTFHRPAAGSPEDSPSWSRRGVADTSAR